MSGISIILISIFIIFISYLFFLNTNLHTNLDTNLNTNTNLQNNTNKDLSFIDGIWISNDEFNELSNINNIILYINYNSNSGHLIIIDKDNQINKYEFDCYINLDTIQKNKDNNIINFDIRFHSADKLFIWKNKIFKSVLTINNGNIKLFYSNTLYADLFKNNEMTYYLNDI